MKKVAGFPSATGDLGHAVEQGGVGGKNCGAGAPGGSSDARAPTANTVDRTERLLSEGELLLRGSCCDFQVFHIGLRILLKAEN